MTNAWHNIWSRRNFEFTSDLSLDFLIKADGFDQGIGDVDSDSWISICVAYAKAMDLQKDMSIFEFGCGAGAFLKPFYDIYRMRVAGIDLSPFLIDVARQVMPHGDFNMCSIEDYVSYEKYDVVVSNSVIHYLNREELGTFIDKATAIAERFILISDIPNLQTKTEAEEYRKKIMLQNGIEKKYEGLCHTYFQPMELTNLFKTKNWDCKLIPIGSLGSTQSRFRFSILATKI